MLSKEEQYSNIIEWLVHKPLPAWVKMHYMSPDGGHPLTPASIRQRYNENVSDSALVVWYKHPYFGIKAGIDELTWRAEDVCWIQLVYSRPAKSSGYICLDVTQHDLPEQKQALSASRFELHLLEWFKPIVSFLQKMFPGKVDEFDEGYDV